MGASESTPATPDLLPKVSAQDTRVLQEMSPHDKMQLESALHQQQKVADREIQEDPEDRQDQVPLRRETTGLPRSLGTLRKREV